MKQVYYQNNKPHRTKRSKYLVSTLSRLFDIFRGSHVSIQTTQNRYRLACFVKKNLYKKNCFLKELLNERFNKLQEM